MNFFDFLTMLGGLCLFLFGMNVMGQSLERRAGNGLKRILGRLTGSKVGGLLTGLGVTAVIQSSSATTVMVVGFVNSGLMTLGQSIYVIMGANIGTTVTAWILSLAGIDSGNIWITLLKPSSFTPILALIGIVLYMFCRSDKKKDTGMILLGFATLMFGMETMSGAVAGLKDVPEFAQLFVAFSNPVLGVLVGALVTAVIQSSSASVGILQALASTGVVSYGSCVPIIMGQNIGTCVTALLSSVGTNKNARRAAMVHLLFNVIGATLLLTVFCITKAIFAPAILNESASLVGIATIHSLFNLLCTLIMLPLGGLLQKVVCLIVPDKKQDDKQNELDERLIVTPALAIAQSRNVEIKMADDAVSALRDSMNVFTDYTPAMAESIRQRESLCDHYEDILGSYLIKISAAKLGEAESEQVTALLKSIGDFERISDHAVNILESAEELRDKGLSFTETAKSEYNVLKSAIEEVLSLSLRAFTGNDVNIARKVEPLEEVIDGLKETLRTRHICRMKEGKCSIEVGFVWSDIITNLERVSDHCSNIAGCVLDMAQHNMDMHKTLNSAKSGGKDFDIYFEEYSKKYSV